MTAPALEAWPAAVLLAGAAGSGKTTLASALAAAAGYVLFDLDQVTGALSAAALALLGESADALDRSAGSALRAGRYASLADAAAANLSLGHRVILAAPFTAECREAAALAALRTRLAAGSPAAADAVLVYLDTPAALRRARLAQRGAARDRAKIAKGDRLAEPERPKVSHVRVDGALETAAQLGALVAALRPPATCPSRSSTC